MSTVTAIIFLGDSLMPEMLSNDNYIQTFAITKASGSITLAFKTCVFVSCLSDSELHYPIYDTIN